MKKILQQAAFPLAIVTFIAHLCRMTGVTPNRSLPFSQNLLAQLHGGKSERISLQELLDGVKTHARATLMILFSLPNLVPSIPGMSAITGLPLLFLAVQMMMGNNVWLPHFIASRSFLRSDLLRLINRLLPYLQRVERVLQPRHLILSRPTVLQVIGLICVVLSVLIALPIPLGNFLPAVVGPLILGGRMHMVTAFTWYSLRYLESAEGHSGYEFSWSPFRLLPFDSDFEYHAYHHSHNIGNYSSAFTVWDTVFDSNKTYYAYLQDRHQAWAKHKQA